MFFSRGWLVDYELGGGDWKGQGSGRCEDKRSV